LAYTRVRQNILTIAILLTENWKFGTGNHMIQVDNLFLQLNGRPILQHVGLSARPGEVTVLLGPNGSGKTTLLLCIAAQRQIQDGVVHLAEHALKDLSPPELARLVALVPQDHHPVFPYTVRELILLGRLSRVSFWGQPTAQDQQVVEDIINLLQLQRLADKPYTQISGGERQLVLIGRCLAQEPQILLLDEPTNHLDFKNKNVILQLICHLAHEHRLTVLLTLHDPNLALLYADYVVMLSAGEVVAAGKPKEVIHAASMSRLYGLDVEMLQQGNRRLLYAK
jgi:iron complex transport system ATP-binding protein